MGKTSQNDSRTQISSYCQCSSFLKNKNKLLRSATYPLIEDTQEFLSEKVDKEIFHLQVSYLRQVSLH